MPISIIGILVNVVMVIIIVILLLVGYRTNQELKVCQQQQSSSCYSIQCPCDANDAPPCFGYAKMPAGDGNFYCSSSPSSLVDAQGKKVGKSVLSV